MEGPRRAIVGHSFDRISRGEGGDGGFRSRWVWRPPGWRICSAATRQPTRRWPDGCSPANWVRDRDIVLLNAAAGLMVAGVRDDLASGLELAAQAIDDGRAEAALERVVEVSRANDPGPAVPS